MEKQNIFLANVQILPCVVLMAGCHFDTLVHHRITSTELAIATYIHIPLAAVLLSRHYTRGCGCLGINKYEPSSVHSLHFSHDQEGWCGNIEMNDKLNKTFFIDWLLHALQLCNAGGYFLEPTFWTIFKSWTFVALALNTAPGHWTVLRQCTLCNCM